MPKFYIEKEEYINKTFRIPIETSQELYKICDKKNISLNKLVLKCIKYALENYDIDKEENEADTEQQVINENKPR